jgi:hypothetical protein
VATPWTTLIEYPLGVAQLASAVTNSATGAGALPLKTGHGTQFSGAVFPIVVTVELEHIICSAIVGDALTVTTRGAYSTTARAHLANATVNSNIMAAHLTEMRTAINAVEDKTQKLSSSGNLLTGITGVDLALSGDLAVNGGDITSSAAAINITPTGDGRILISADGANFYSTYGNFANNAEQAASTSLSTASYFRFRRKNAAGNQIAFGTIYAWSPTTTTGGEIGRIQFGLMGGVTPGTNELDAIVLSNTLLSTTKPFTAAGNVTASGGTVTAGVAATTRGIFSARSGSGGAAPGCLLLMSKNGTAYYFWPTDAGELRRHTSLPTADTDGSAV